MIGIGLGVDWGSVSLNKTAVVFETEYQAVLDRGTALGYTLPSYNQQILQNNLLKAMKSSGVWAKLDVFYNFANNGSVGFGMINWKTPNANLATTPNGITFTQNIGVTGGGTAHVNTGFSPSNGVQYQQNNASRYLYLYASGGGNPLDGISGASGNSMFNSTTTAQRINGPAVSSFFFNLTRGMKSIHRTTATSQTMYNDITGTTQSTGASTARDTGIQAVLRSSNAYGGGTVSMYAMGASMIAENAAFVAAYNTYINALT